VVVVAEQLVVAHTPKNASIAKAKKPIVNRVAYKFHRILLL